MVGTAVRLVVAGLYAWGGWHWLGPGGLVLTSPLVAYALTRPLASLLSGGVRWSVGRAYQPVQGRHYAFQDISLAVMEDDERRRWMRAADIRRVLAGFPRDEVLAQVLNAGQQCLGPNNAPGLYVSVDALGSLLERTEQPRARRFKHWVQREVERPSGSARRARRGLAQPLRSPE
jgi:hypothetical protein